MGFSNSVNLLDLLGHTSALRAWYDYRERMAYLRDRTSKNSLPIFRKRALDAMDKVKPMKRPKVWKGKKGLFPTVSSSVAAGSVNRGVNHTGKFGLNIQIGPYKHEFAVKTGYGQTVYQPWKWSYRNPEVKDSWKGELSFFISSELAYGW